MKYGNIIYYDVANGVGIRTTLFVSGCRRHCKGCFNEETWDFNYGKEFNEEVEDRIIRSLTEYIDGITILGGEPMEPENQPIILNLLRRVKKEYPNKNVWLYTGCYIENLFNEKEKYYIKGMTERFFSENLIDTLVDGPFIENCKDPSLNFRGSTNQRIIDVKETIKNNKVTLDKRFY